jgi:glycerophosphoryl diester phosphodiesterase
MAGRQPYLDHEGPIAFAHRGGAAEAPENTIAAFERAVGLGYRYLETDVQVTADGVLVVFHDDDLRRLCGRPERVDALPWDEVATLRVRGTEPIPTFDDLLGRWPEVRFNVDCKTDRAVAPLVDVITGHGALDRVCVASFSDRRIRRIRSLAGPRLCTAAARWELAALWAVGMRLGGAAAQVPQRRGPVTIATERLVRRARRRGMPVHVWTVDDRGEMGRLLDIGVAGLITDRPAVLREVLVEREQWPV